MSDKLNFIKEINLSTDQDIEMPAEDWQQAGEIVDRLKSQGLINQSEEYMQVFRDESDYRRIELERLEKWKDMDLSLAITTWLLNITTSTHETYKYAIEDLKKRNLIVTTINSDPIKLGHFYYQPHSKILNDIKNIDKSDDPKEDAKRESARQVKAAAYISFTNWLHNTTNGWFRKAIPTSNTTFYNIYDKCQSNALSLSEWYNFISELNKINKRDALIAKALFQGAKRVSEVVSLQLDQISWEKNIINYKQSKNKTIKFIPINYPKNFMNELSEYITLTADYRKDSKDVFVTRNGKCITRLRLNYSFAKAAE